MRRDTAASLDRHRPSARGVLKSGSSAPLPRRAVRRRPIPGILGSNGIARIATGFRRHRLPRLRTAWPETGLQVAPTPPCSIKRSSSMSAEAFHRLVGVGGVFVHGLFQRFEAPSMSHDAASCLGGAKKPSNEQRYAGALRGRPCPADVHCRPILHRNECIAPQVTPAKSTARLPARRRFERTAAR